jgi:hypothetical protein
MIASIENNPQRYARMAGVLYLAIIFLGLFGEMYARGTLVVSGDAAATSAAILASPLLWRAGIAGDLLMHVFDLPAMVVLYYLLRPVSRSLALFATLANGVQTAVLVANKMTLLIPLFLLESSRYVTAFSPEQAHAAAYIAINAHGYGFGIGLIFFGVACLVRGYLIFMTGYLPKTLGVLMAMAGLSYLLNSFALLLAPKFAAAMFPWVMLPSLLGELALTLWLIVKGVNVQQWRRRAQRSNGT